MLGAIPWTVVSALSNSSWCSDVIYRLFMLRVSQGILTLFIINCDHYYLNLLSKESRGRSQEPGWLFLYSIVLSNRQVAPLTQPVFTDKDQDCRGRSRNPLLPQPPACSLYRSSVALKQRSGFQKSWSHLSAGIPSGEVPGKRFFGPFWGAEPVHSRALGRGCTCGSSLSEGGAASPGT